MPEHRTRTAVGAATSFLLLLAAADARAHVTDPENAPAVDPPGGGSGGLFPPDPNEPPNLFPRVPIARAAGWIFPPGPLPAAGEDEAEARLEEYFDDALGRDRIEVGQVDGWYQQLGRAMRDEFRPDRGAIEGERRAGMNPLQLIYDELRRYGRGPERPQDVPGQQLPEQFTRDSRDPTDRRFAVEQEQFDWMNPLNAPVTWYRVDVRVTHNPEGEMSASWVLRSSGLRTLDQAALDAARAGAVHRPAPPESVVGERQAIRSDWAFEFGDVATFWGSMTPGGTGALASGGCVEDYRGEWQCAVLGRGIVRTRVRLLRVVDATHLTAAERRQERRANEDRPRP